MRYLKTEDRRKQGTKHEGRGTRDESTIVYRPSSILCSLSSVICFAVYILIFSSTAVGNQPDMSDEPAPARQALQASKFADFSAAGGPTATVKLGSVDPNSGFMFQMDLSSRGGSVSRVALSGFFDHDYNNPQPLILLSAIKSAPDQVGGGSEISTMATRQLVLVDLQRQFALDRLSWSSAPIEIAPDGSQTARFEVLIKGPADEPILKVSKTYKVSMGSYLAECTVTVENLSAGEQKIRYNLTGPVGIGRESTRSDMRKVMGGFLDEGKNVVPAQQDLVTSFFGKFRNNFGLKDASSQYQQALQSGSSEQINTAKDKLRIGNNLPDRYKNQAYFLWAAITNKYFAAILRPVPDDDKDYCDWIWDKDKGAHATAWFYNPDSDIRADSGDETVGVNLEITPVTLAANGQTNSTKTYNFQLYLGPKDRTLFNKNDLYRRLGFVYTIDFMPCCCCPAAIIRPLAFGILATMKWMYGFIPNYGFVIIILVFVIRIIIHPLTKKSQVSMSKMTELAPKAEEIRKKYVNNKTEMNKQLMALYREQGATPIMGMLPMMVQMPIWIALWSAVNASIDLRGAVFLPFWITDLSMPDALVRFATVTVPMLNWKIESLNLLPILMGVAFYLQQKLMPSQSSAPSSPQMAQQQKMMMIMFPFLMPIMFYNLPSGVNLYIMTSTFAGVIEQHIIRRHINEKKKQQQQGLVPVTSKTGGKVKKKKPKPFFRV